jgi:Protein of unknown function (DUF2971)
MGSWPGLCKVTSTKNFPGITYEPMNRTAEATKPRRSSNDFQWLRTFLDSIPTRPPGELGRGSLAPDKSLIPKPGSVTDLYHYTDLGGLKGIIDAGDLWLTHCRFSNDNEELTHGKDIARQKLDERAVVKSLPEGQGYLNYLERLKALLDQPVADGVYICCFCEKNDLLSQWRGYGANGAGVCIKFKKEELSHLTGYCKVGILRLWKVIYPLEQQQYLIDHAIDYGWKNGCADSEERAKRSAEAIRFLIPTFKNPGFAEEEEWRLIFTPDPTLHVEPAFRTGRNMLIPYYGLQSLGWGDKPLPITGVCVGPGIHKEINAQSVQMLLERRNCKGRPECPGVRVEISKTPYRG